MSRIRPKSVLTFPTYVPNVSFRFFVEMERPEAADGGGDGRRQAWQQRSQNVLLFLFLISIYFLIFWRKWTPPG